MSEADHFPGLVDKSLADSRTLAEAARVAEQAKQAAMEAARLRDQQLEGTRPEDVLDAESATLCHGFLTMVRPQGYPGATVLRTGETVVVPDRRSVFGFRLPGYVAVEVSRTMIGYPVGVFDDLKPYEHDRVRRVQDGDEDRLFTQALLCSDGKLRRGRGDRILGDLPIELNDQGKWTPTRPTIGRVTEQRFKEIITPESDLKLVQSELIEGVDQKFTSADLRDVLVGLATSPHAQSVVVDKRVGYGEKA